MSTSSGTEPGQYIAFRLGHHTLLSSLENIDEIVDLMKLNQVPGTVPWFLGLGAHKGQLLPVSDLGRFAGGAASTASANTRLLIIIHGPDRVGLAVDDVTGLVEPEEPAPDGPTEEVGSLPALLQSLVTDRKIVEGKSAFVLALPALLELPEFIRIANVAAEVPA